MLSQWLVHALCLSVSLYISVHHHPYTPRSVWECRKFMEDRGEASVLFRCPRSGHPYLVSSRAVGGHCAEQLAPVSLSPTHPRGRRETLIDNEDFTDKIYRVT